MKGLINISNTMEHLKKQIENWDSDKLVRFYAGYRSYSRFQTDIFEIPQGLKHDAFYIVSQEMNKRKIDKTKVMESNSIF